MIEDETSFSIVIPDALPMRFVSLKPTVTAKHSIIKIQLISGIYIWPCILDDVWIIFTLGKHPKAEHCFMMEKVPVIMAWLPTTAASMAIASTGHRIRSNMIRVVMSICRSYDCNKFGEPKRMHMLTCSSAQDPNYSWADCLDYRLIMLNKSHPSILDIWAKCRPHLHGQIRRFKKGHGPNSMHVWTTLRAVQFSYVMKAGMCAFR